MIMFGSGFYLSIAAFILGVQILGIVGEEMERWAEKQLKKMKKRGGTK